MPSRFVRAIVIAVGAVAASACDVITGPVCTDEARPALIVEIRDSVTNAPAGMGARVIARDGAYADTGSVLGAEGSRAGLAHEREGTYTVTVEKDGYRPWTRNGIRVTKDACHVRTVSVPALLQQ
jgi:hypothetical protein